MSLFKTAFNSLPNKSFRQGHNCTQVRRFACCFTETFGLGFGELLSSTWGVRTLRFNFVEEMAAGDFLITLLDAASTFSLMTAFFKPWLP